MARRNPLDDEVNGGGWIGQAPRMDEEALRQWAAEQNAKPLSLRASWWYYVRRNEDGRWFVDKLEGIAAEDARARAQRRPLKEFKPTDADLANIREFVANCVSQGMTQAEFNRMVDRTGGARRA